MVPSSSDNRGWTVVAVDLEWFWIAFSNDIHLGLLYAMYTGRCFQWLRVEFNNVIHCSFDALAQNDYKLVAP